MADAHDSILLSAIQDIHTSIAALRNDVNSRNERLASLEATIKALIGNGKPGTIQQMQTQISANTAFRNKVLGAIGVLACSTFGELVVIIYHLVTATHKG